MTSTKFAYFGMGFRQYMVDELKGNPVKSMTSLNENPLGTILLIYSDLGYKTNSCG